MVSEKSCSGIKKIRFGFLEQPLSRLCFQYAWFVAEHPWPFILVPILITVGCGYGYLNKYDVDDINKYYVPMDALGLTERAVIAEHFPPLNGTYVPSRSINEDGQVVVIVTAQDEGNILRPDYRKATIDLNEYIMDKIHVIHDNQKYTYRQICIRFLQFCHTNPQIYAMNAMYSSSNPSSFDNNTYPTAQHGSRRFYIVWLLRMNQGSGNTLGGVTLDPLSRQIVQAKAWQLVYQMNASQTLWPITYKLMREMERRLLAYDDDLLDIAFLHSMSLNIEIKRNSTDNNLALRFALCAFMLWFFACFCSITTMQSDGKFYVDWSRTKFTVATCGLLGAIMGIVTGIGFLSYCQYDYNSVVDAMPFLVLGVRLDNTFLMISAVHHTKRHLSAQERLSEAMSEAAVSITITVLTDILSFATGLFTDFYSVIVFSVYTIVTVSITFAYQLTFLMGVLALSLKSEQNNVHSVATCKEVIDPGNVGKVGCFSKWFCLGSKSGYQASDKNDPKNRRALALSRSLSLREQTEGGKVPYQEGTWISRTIRLKYAPFLMRLETKLIVLFVYIAYLAAAIYGCVTTRQGLEPMRLLVHDSYAIKYYVRLEQYFWHVGTQAQLVFSNPGDLSDPANRRRIVQIVNQFANSSHGMGPEGVDFWLTSFENFMLEFDGQNLDTLRGDEFFANVDYFLSIEENAQYRNDIRWSNKGRPSNITAFRALVGMKNFAKALDQMATVDSFRNLALSYSEYNITTFQIMWLFVDQYEEVLPNTIQEIYSGTAFMILIAIFFIPSVISSLWVALAILSIDAGMIGFMAFWGINLDVISMITIIMSIGFSVDFTAHIAYAYVVIDGKDNVERTVNALSTLAWPITQGGIATVMGVVVLAGTNSYITTAFFRTVFLVIIIGWAHALIFLPVVLSVFSCKLSTKYVRSCWSKIKSGNRDRNVDQVDNDNRIVTVLEPADLHKYDANELQLQQKITINTPKNDKVFVKIEDNVNGRYVAE